MPVGDCGTCEQLLCGSKIASQDQFFTLTSNLLCEIAENQENPETGFPRILELLEEILAALGGP